MTAFLKTFHKQIDRYKKSKLLWLCMPIIVAGFLYVSFIGVIPLCITPLILVLFFFLGTKSVKPLVIKALNPEPAHVVPLSFALFLFLVSISGGIPLIFYKLEFITESIFLSLPLLLGLYQPKVKSLLEPIEKESPWSILKSPKKYVTVFLGMSALFLGFLIAFSTGEHILNPWQSIHPLAVWLVMALTVFVLWSIFSPMKKNGVLLLLIIHSFVLHAYIPITYDGGFGGDRWRHIASERYFLTGEIYTPGLIGEVEVPKQTVAGVTVPEVFIAGNKSSYAPQWILTLFLHQMTGVSLESVDEWLVPLIWFWLVIIGIYEISRFFFKDQRWRLFMTFIPILFFPYQVYGSITIPVGFAQLSFLFILWAWLRYISEGTVSSKYFGIIAIVLGYFHYILHFILSIILAALALTQKKISQKKNLTQGIVGVLSIVILAAFIPVLEHIFGLSWFTEALAQPQSIFKGLADAFGRITNLIGYTHYGSHIGQGNFLYEASRLPASTVSFLRWPYWPFGISILVYGISVVGFWSAIKNKATPAWRLVSTFLIALSVSYFISWFVMDGYRTLARRLDLSIALLVSFLFAYGAYRIMLKLSNTHRFFKKNGLSRKALVVFAIAGVSFATTSTFASGPILDRVTKNEYLAALYVWDKIQDKPPYCVIANTWPLLGLESASGRKLVGGGFPVYREYSQPERVKIFEDFSKHPSQELLSQALSVTQASECVYMTEFRFMNTRVFEETKTLLGPPEKQIGEVFIWTYDRTSI